MAISQDAVPTTVGGTKKALLVVTGLLALYFAYEQVIPYFAWSEEAYGYYWQFRVALLLHIVGGTIALLGGVFQLWSGLNRRAMRTHPLTGRVYATGVLLGAAGAYWLSVASAAYGFAWGTALFVLATAWLVTTGTAIYCIRARRVVDHQRWMVRSYIVTFGFVLFRILTGHVPYEELWGIAEPEWSNAIIWPVWVVPLIGYEMLLTFRRR